MDLSKLPKLSQTAEAEKQRAAAAAANPNDPSPPPAAVTPHDRVVPPYSHAASADPIVAAEVWLSAILGLAFCYLGGTFARYVLARLTGQDFQTGVVWSPGTPKAGQNVSYFDLEGYTAWTDASLFLFGLALLADAALLLASRRPAVVWTAFALTLLAVGMNLVTTLLVWSAGIFPLFSLLAVAVGGYMLAYQWREASATRVR